MPPQTPTPTLKTALLAAQASQNPAIAIQSAHKAAETIASLSQDSTKALARLPEKEVMMRAQVVRNGEAKGEKKRKADEMLAGLVQQERRKRVMAVANLIHDEDEE